MGTVTTVLLRLIPVYNLTPEINKPNILKITEYFFKERCCPGHNNECKHRSKQNIIQERPIDVKLSDETVNEFNKSRNTLKSRMESLLNNPQMKKFER